MFQDAVKWKTDPVARALLRAFTTEALQCGPDRLLTGFLEVVPTVVAAADDPIGFARELQRIATAVIIQQREGDLTPAPSELIPGCKLWMLEPKRLLDETIDSHPWAMSDQQQQYLHEGLLRRISGSCRYISIWPQLPSAARSRRDHELDFDLNAAIRTGRMTQPRCQEILAYLYGRGHADLFDPVFEVIDLVQRGKSIRPEDFPAVDLDQVRPGTRDGDHVGPRILSAGDTAPTLDHGRGLGAKLR
jgi:hypothetical protein